MKTRRRIRGVNQGGNGGNDKNEKNINVRVTLEFHERFFSLCRRHGLNTGIIGREALRKIAEQIEREGGLKLEGFA